ncbi:hypothetical protein JXA02_07055 [candidate division KSB1 bacterium]|nr:hypothetical protein [candidate division KSB1 bacterium]RQW06713.1 MAG: hypothetical protein EH222_08220 [candidate division KSB1 bacterium]
MKLSCFLFLTTTLLPLVTSAQDVTIDAIPQTSDVQLFMLSDFNFSGRGTSAAELFLITMTNSSNAEQLCELFIEIVAESQGLLASGNTKPFMLAPNELIRVTNRDLFTKAQQFSLENYQIADVGNELSSILLATGRLPADIYIFRFQLKSGGFMDEAEIRFVLTNPTTLDLISPGVIATSEEDGVIYTPLPLFRWESEISAFRLMIAEQLPDAHDDLSPEEVMQQRVIYQQTLVVSGAPYELAGQVIPSTLFQYPIDGRPLQEGVTYYWQIVGLVKSSGEWLEIAGEIWKFRIIGTGETAVLTPLQQQILNLVRELDGSLFKPGGALRGYIPTELVSKNGVILSEDAIIDALSRLVDGEYELLDASVE